MSVKIMIRVAIAALKTSLILEIAFVFLARRSRKQSGIEGIDEAKRTKAKNFIVERREGEIFCERE